MGFVRYVDREVRDQRIRLLRAAGLSLRQVGAIVGCHKETVNEACDPELKVRRNAERAARNTSPEGLQRQRDYRTRKAK